jgi:hypothetical protein
MVTHPKVALGAGRAQTLILRSPRDADVSKDAGPSVASWFETRFALLTMRSTCQPCCGAPLPE